MSNFLIVLACWTFVGARAATYSNQELFIEASVNGPVYLQERIIVSCGTFSKDIRNLTWIPANSTSNSQTEEPSTDSFAGLVPLTTTIIIIAEESVTYTCTGLRKDGTTTNMTFQPVVNGSAEVMSTIEVSDVYHLSRTVTLINPTLPISLNCHARRHSSSISFVATSTNHRCQLNSSIPSFGPGYDSYSCGQLTNFTLVGNDSHQCVLMRLSHGESVHVKGQSVQVIIRKQKVEVTIEELSGSRSSLDDERCYSTHVGNNSGVRIFNQECTATDISKVHRSNRQNSSFCIDQVISGDTIQFNCTGVYTYPTIPFGLHGGFLYSQDVFHVASVVEGPTLPVTSSTTASVTGEAKPDTMNIVLSTVCSLMVLLAAGLVVAVFFIKRLIRRHRNRPVRNVYLLNRPPRAVTGAGVEHIYPGRLPPLRPIAEILNEEPIYEAIEQHREPEPDLHQESEVERNTEPVYASVNKGRKRRTRRARRDAEERRRKCRPATVKEEREDEGDPVPSFIYIAGYREPPDSHLVVTEVCENEKEKASITNEN